MPRGFPLKRTFNTIISQLLRGGIVNKWTSDYQAGVAKFKALADHDNSEKQLTIDHLQGAFILLSYGLVFALISFVMELIVGYRRKIFGACRENRKKVGPIPTVKISKMDRLKVVPPVKKLIKVEVAPGGGESSEKVGESGGGNRRVQLKKITRNREGGGQKWIIEVYEYWE